MKLKLSELIAHAFQEDLPNGDLTTDSLQLDKVPGKARLLAKEDFVLAGTEVFTSCMRYFDPSVDVHWQFKDGDFVLDKQVVAWLRGDLISILKSERVALNFLGRMCGIATLTRCFVKETEGTKCKILDTRKTTPLLRELEKQAVRAGGGHNHRMNLSSAIMIKDNHIRAAGGIETAIRRIRANCDSPIEVECRTLDEVRTAVKERVQRILLDNMTLDQIREARELIPAVIEVEVSGNVTLERVREIATLDVDYISVGALTHSAPIADLSLMFEWPAVDSVEQV